MELTVRLKRVGDLFNNLPETATAIVNHLLGTRGVPAFSFAVGMLPPTVNHAYIHTRFNTRLSEEYLLFKKMVDHSVKLSRNNFKIRATAAVVILLESPRWVTKKSTIREMDADNRVKPMLDAMQESLEIPDETNWEIHVYKIASAKEQVTCFVFDLGEVVNYHSS